MDHHTPANKEELGQWLKELAMDLHWSWNHATDKIWRQLDATLWELTHNPLVVLQTVSHNRISEVLDDPIVREIIEELIEAKRQRAVSPAWFQNNVPSSALTQVAYFSMEYMLSEALPIYSGGLGNVSGDLLKTASDLGVPVTGVGLLYHQGYSRQVIQPDGRQQYVSPFNDPGNLPITPLRTESGEWLRIEVSLPGFSVWLRTWEVEVGRVKLLLLDSNDVANFPLYRSITNQLYGSDATLRLMQELILGIGGWRLLQQLGIRPDVCHLNEGHCAFLVLERALDRMQEDGLSFDEALTVTRSGNIFTTHTAIGAGFDLFPPAMLEQYLGSYVCDRLKISFADFLALGRKNPADANEPFNTSFLAFRGCGYVNGVSQLHGEVSRQLFSPLFPRWPLDEIPIGHVTNGVHMSTWDSPAADVLWTETCGKERWLGSLGNHERNIATASDERLWQLRTQRIADFLDDVREHDRSQLATTGASVAEMEKARTLFDPSYLTIGFARRFVPYKRTNLLLRDPERLKAILLHPQRPVQLVLAGKAHAADTESQEMIREWVQFIRDAGVQHRAVFLSDYDMLLTEQMVQGVDLWINTPRRPWEACGTSGMKVLVNGGLNLSELDGWWDEAYSPEVGWTFGDRRDMPDDRLHDEEDAERLYAVLENEIVPLFYQRNEKGLPALWLEKMRNSMAQLTWRYSSTRALQEYTLHYYLPAASRYHLLAANRSEQGRRLLDRKKHFAGEWPGLRYGQTVVASNGTRYHFAVPVFLNGLHPDEIEVELYAEGVGEKPPIRQKMQPLRETDGAIVYETDVPADKPSNHYTPRIVAAASQGLSSLENSFIRWP